MNLQWHQRWQQSCSRRRQSPAPQRSQRTSWAALDRPEAQQCSAWLLLAPTELCRYQIYTSSAAPAARMVPPRRLVPEQTSAGKDRL